MHRFYENATALYRGTWASMISVSMESIPRSQTLGDNYSEIHYFPLNMLLHSVITLDAYSVCTDGIHRWSGKDRWDCWPYMTATFLGPCLGQWQRFFWDAHTRWTGTAGRHSGTDSPRCSEEIPPHAAPAWFITKCDIWGQGHCTH